jgi:TolB protein
MKYNFLILSLLINSALFAAFSEPLVKGEENQNSIQVTPKEHAKLKLLLVTVGEQKQELKNILSIVKKDLEFSGQFTVDIEPAEQIATKKEVAGLFERGYSLALFFNVSSKNDGIEWRLYDTTQIVMLKGSKTQKRGLVLRGWAHNVSDAVWLALTGQEGFFSTKIAYCKQVSMKRKKKVTHVFAADYDGSNEELLVATPTVNVAPRWNRDGKTPLLFYSEYTNANVRLVSVNMQKKRKIASDYDGVNMLPAFSKDGKRVVYCASRGNGSCQLYCYDQGALKKLTNNQGNNVSPTFSDDGTKIFYCSDYQTGTPQIYCYDTDKNQQIRLTENGYCASPAFCGKQNRVAYSKIVNGIMQLYVYDVITKEHTQLTFDAGHKEEAAWSPCGNYLIFSVEQGAQSRIAMLNLITNDRHYITPSSAVCSYPAWSTVYDEFPVVVA